MIGGSVLVGEMSHPNYTYMKPLFGSQTEAPHEVDGADEYGINTGVISEPIWSE